MSAQSIMTYLLSWITFLLRNGEGMYDHAKHSEGPVMLWEYSSVTRITTPLVMDVVQENVHCKSFLLRLHCQKCCSWSTWLEDIIWISRFFVAFDQNNNFHQPIPDRQVGKRTQNDPARPYRAQSWVYDNMFFSNCCGYEYSKFRVQPSRIPPVLFEMMAALMPVCGITNQNCWPTGVNVNFYPDGYVKLD